MRKVVVLAEAASDIEEARDFYDRQEPGIGDHGIHFRQFGVYRMLAERFPFGIYYRETKTETQVVAVLDLRRDPNRIRRELSWHD